MLSPQFSKELIEQKKAVAFIANKDGQIDIPLQIVGQLPKPKVLPDVTELANRAGSNAVQAQGQKYLGKIFGKKGLPGGLGKFLGGNSGGNNGSGNGSSLQAAAHPQAGSHILTMPRFYIRRNSPFSPISLHPCAESAGSIEEIVLISAHLL